MDQPLINGIAYSWSSIKVNIMGRPVAGISAIEYSDEQDIEGNPGAGNKPVDVGFGEITLGGSLTLRANEVEALEDLSPTGRLQDLPMFPIIVSYKAGNKVKIHRLLNCILKHNKRSSQPGDKKIDVEIPLFIGDIKWK